MTSCMMGLCEHVTGKGGREKKIIFVLVALVSLTWKWEITAETCAFVCVSESLRETVCAQVFVCPDSRTKGVRVHDKLLTHFISAVGPQSDCWRK